MSDYLEWAWHHKISIMLILGVLIAIWYVMRHRDKLMLDKAPPPKK